MVFEWERLELQRRDIGPHAFDGAALGFAS